jgi:hypothetical protein
MTWDAGSITVNCIAHIFNLSAKALMLGRQLISSYNSNNTLVPEDNVHYGED